MLIQITRPYMTTPSLTDSAQIVLSTAHKMPQTALSPCTKAYISPGFPVWPLLLSDVEVSHKGQ